MIKMTRLDTGLGIITDTVDTAGSVAVIVWFAVDAS